MIVLHATLFARKVAYAYSSTKNYKYLLISSFYIWIPSCFNDRCFKHITFGHYNLFYSQQFLLLFFCHTTQGKNFLFTFRQFTTLQSIASWRLNKRKYGMCLPSHNTAQRRYLKYCVDNVETQVRRELPTPLRLCTSTLNRRSSLSIPKTLFPRSILSPRGSTDVRSLIDQPGVSACALNPPSWLVLIETCPKEQGFAPPRASLEVSMETIGCFPYRSSSIHSELQGNLFDRSTDVALRPSGAARSQVDQRRRRAVTTK